VASATVRFARPGTRRLTLHRAHRPQTGRLAVSVRWTPRGGRAVLVMRR
jgi:hypothetical protein